MDRTNILYNIMFWLTLGTAIGFFGVAMYSVRIGYLNSSILMMSYAQFFFIIYLIITVKKDIWKLKYGKN